MIPTKICGITNLSDAQAAMVHGASAIGFIFYEKSPRHISIDDAKFISDHLKKDLSRVGVFVNHKKEYINQAIQEVPLNVIQFHGDESPEICKQFDVPIIKAIQIKDEDSLSVMDEYIVNGFLLDTFLKDHYGGTGKAFDWSLLNGQMETPIILSGGLNPNNISDAITFTKPSAVDVNSGVESSPGIKDHKKIKLLFERLKDTDTTGFHFG